MAVILQLLFSSWKAWSCSTSAAVDSSTFAHLWEAHQMFLLLICPFLHACPAPHLLACLLSIKKFHLYLIEGPHPCFTSVLGTDLGSFEAILLSAIFRFPPHSVTPPPTEGRLRPVITQSVPIHTPQFQLLSLLLSSAFAVSLNPILLHTSFGSQRSFFFFFLSPRGRQKLGYNMGVLEPGAGSAGGRL